MKIVYSTTFIKHYKKRILDQSLLKERFKERLAIFLSKPKDPILKDHPLKGKKEKLRAFSITGDIRVIYIINNNIAYFYDIGTHNQVY